MKLCRYLGLGTGFFIVPNFPQTIALAFLDTGKNGKSRYLLNGLKTSLLHLGEAQKWLLVEALSIAPGYNYA